MVISDLSQGKGKREKDFYRNLDETIKNLNDGVCMIGPGGYTVLLSVFTRFHEMFGLYISYSDSVDHPEFEDDYYELVKEFIPFVEEFEDKKRDQVCQSLLLEEWAFLMYEDWEKMNNHYDQVEDHGIAGNPFYLCTFEDTGAIMRENT